MKILVEVSKCCGHARCAAVAPEVYKLNEIGYLDTPEIEISGDLASKAIRGLRACPERCISVKDDER